MDCPACHHPNIDGARFCASCGALLPHLAPDAADPLIGQVIGGRYRITQLLGEGGMGRVYLAEQQMGTNVRKIALKTLQAQFANDAQTVARFHRECGTVSELEHPNTIQFFDFGQTPSGELYIAMEYVQGESLASVLEKQGTLPPERVERILGQVCGSLEEAHGRGIVHRDLKPDNVVLTTRAGQPDFVKVLDFGIAKRREAKDTQQEQKLTQQGMVLGTPPYMSPEQFTGKELGAASDIYSLGVMAYEMLTGRLPFEADTPWQWATAHMTAQPYPFETTPAAAAIPPKMKAAILKALAKRPEERQASARQFFDELSGGAADRGSVVGGPPSAAPVPKTAAMSEVDLVRAAAAPREKTQAGAPLVFAPPAGPAPSATPAAMAAPVVHAPAGAGKKDGSKGLLIGLGGAAGVLLLIGVVLAARGSRADDDPPGIGPITATSGGDTTPLPVPPDPVPSSTAAATATPPTTATPAATTPAVHHTGGTPAPTTTTPPPAPTPTTPPPPVVSGDEACKKAREAADGGNISGAAAYYRKCSGPGAAAAAATIRKRAEERARAEAFNGRCAEARNIVNAASGVGLGGGAASALASAPSCKGK